MIKILNANFERQAILKNVISLNRFEEINGENTLTFSTILDKKTSTYINENAVIEIDNDYFDIVYYKKNQNDDGTLTVDVETEHISYRLNNSEYDMEYFAATGTPAIVLSAILSGTDFTVDTIEFSGNMTYSIQEKKSRRMMLMEFVALLGGEINFNKFAISILQHKGSQEPKLLTKGKNIKIVSKIFNKREKDKNGNPLVSYICEPVILPEEPLALGDEVLLFQKDLGIQEQLRIVRIGINPYNPIEADIELANFISGLEDDIYHIQTSTVAKEKVYNGCRIGPDEGFVAERSDGKTKTVMNATEGISIFSDTGNGLERNFYVDLDGRIKAKEIDIDNSGTFGGKVKVIDNEKMVMEVFKDVNGGRIKIYDKDGKLNVAIGSEAGTASNVGGTIVLFNDSPYDTSPQSDSYQRVELGISKDYDAGTINLRKGDGQWIVAISSDDGDRGYIAVQNGDGNWSRITPTSGQINGEEIATRTWANNQFSEKNHNHDGDYSAVGHNHSEYATASDVLTAVNNVINNHVAQYHTP